MKREKRVQFRVYDVELEDIQNAAQSYGVTVGKFLRERALFREMEIPRFDNLDKDLLRELSAIGNNLNQITKRVNKGQVVVLDEIMKNQKLLQLALEKI